MPRGLLACLACFAALGAPGAAFGTLTDLGTVTRDTVTGLDWLDLEETAGLSYNQVIVSALVLEDGWRYATESELCAFLGGTCPGAGTISRPELLDLWNPLGQLSGIYDSGPAPGSHYLLAMGVAIECCSDLDYDVGSLTFSDSNSGQNGIGSLLVRPIPEPGTGILLFGGTLALAHSRRYARRHPA